MAEFELPHHHGAHAHMEYIRRELGNVEHFAAVSEVFKQLSDPTRARIFWLLSHQEECVVNIAALLEMSSPAVFHHLRSLTESGLLVSRRDGKEVYYRAPDTQLCRLLHEIVEQAKRDGYVTTLFGRRRELSELKSSNFNIRSFGERVALNTPIQGTAADIIKLAMIRVDAALRKQKLKARLVLQVHDELIVECPIKEAEQVKKIVTAEMENVVHLNVPLLAEAKSGASWYEAK